MSYETRAYDNEFGEPVVVLVATGTHDVSRLVNLLARGTIEQIQISDKVLRQVRRHNGGREALRLLKAHGGPDLIEEAGEPEGLSYDRLVDVLRDELGGYPVDVEGVATRLILEGS